MHVEVGRSGVVICTRSLVESKRQDEREVHSIYTVAAEGRSSEGKGYHSDDSHPTS